MATTDHRTPASKRALLLGIWCTLLVAGCDTSPSDPQGSDQPSTTQPTADEPQPQTPTSAVSTPSPTPAIKPAKSNPKPLNLSRGTNLDSLEDTTDIGGDDPDNLLPDLFKDQSKRSGARASGRVLMSETEEASLQAIEGVEFKLEVPVN